MKTSRPKTVREKTSRRPPQAPAPPFPLRRPVWTAAAAFALAVLVFYWTPLTDPNTTPQWDTIDQHYSVQKFAAEELKSFRLPQWTEFSFSGFPFLADPQAGVWYPLNWPFFAAGIGPKSMQLEIALHAFLACLGAWLLARVWLGSAWQAALTAVAYGFSGFFAGHASHLGMFQTAAWLPLLLYGVHTSIRTPGAGAIALSGAGCACMFLAGHFQTALYCFAAIGVYGFAVAAVEKRWLAAVRVLAACAVLAILLSAIQWLPTAELVAQSERASMNFAAQTNAPLEWRAFWTLVLPDVYGSLSGAYTGPEDRTQFYFYGGLLLVPLAAAGLAAGRLRWVALALIVPFAWYAFGPAAGLYRLAAYLPGFRSVRAPVHAWFVVALGLALAAGAGVGMVQKRAGLRRLAVAFALVTFCDVFYANSLRNHLAYARQSFQIYYGNAQAQFARAVRPALPAETRFHSPTHLPGFGPANHAYELRVPVTYGYNPLALQRYREYYAAANGNPHLLNALAAGASHAQSGYLEKNSAVLPKIFFPKRLTSTGPREGLSRLSSANPLENALVEGPTGEFAQDETAGAIVRQATMERYVVETRASAPSLLRAAIPWYPAWRAKVDGKVVPARIVDHAMTGIPVPAGTHEVVLEYDAASFRTGMYLSLLTALALVGGFALRRLRSRRAS